jgi:hypothetical protein
VAKRYFSGETSGLYKDFPLFASYLPLSLSLLQFLLRLCCVVPILQPLQNIHNPSPTMSARPQNIGIKAIEVYFPTQVSVSD